MIASKSIADTIAALMFTQLDVDHDGHVRAVPAPRRDDLRRRQRHYQRHARLRKLLA